MPDIYGNPIEGEEDQSQDLPFELPPQDDSSSAGSETRAPGLQALLGGAGGVVPPGFNFTPEMQDPRFHEFTQGQMDIGAAQPRLDQLGQQGALMRLLAPQAPGPQRSVNPWAAGLGGLAEALGLASRMRKGKRIKYRLLGRKHEKYVSGGREAAPPSAAPPAGSILSSILMGPMMEHMRAQQAFERRTAAFNQAMGPVMARAQMTIPPKLPVETPLARNHRFITELESQGKAPPGTAASYIVGLASGKKGQPSSREWLLDLQKNSPSDYRMVMKTENEIRSYGKNPKTAPMDPGERRYRTLKGEERFARESGTISPALSRTVAPIRKRYASMVADNQQKVQHLQSVRDHLNAKIMGVESGLDPAVTMMPPEELAQHAQDLHTQLDLMDKQIQRQSQREGALQKLEENEVRKVLKIPAGVAVNYDDRPEEMGQEMDPQMGMEGAPQPDSGELTDLSQMGGQPGGSPPLPEGFDPFSTGNDEAQPPGTVMDIDLPDGSKMSEWTPELWQELQQADPSTYQQYVQHIQQALHGMP